MQNVTRERWQDAIALGEAAIARDPNFVQAYCLLNEAHLYRYRFGVEHASEDLIAAKEAAETALRLEPDREEARLALARYYYHGLTDYERTEQELARIPAVGSHEVEYFNLASLVARRQGRWAVSIRDGLKAIELDPRDAGLVVNIMQTYAGLRQFEASERVSDAAMRRLGDKITTRLWIVKSEAALGMGNLEAKRAALESVTDKDNLEYQLTRFWLEVLAGDAARVRELSANASEEIKKTSSFWTMLGAHARRQGEADVARAHYAEARKIAQANLDRRPENAEVLAELALAAAGYGEKEEAMRLAQRAVEMRPVEADALEGPRLQMVRAEIMAMNGDQDGALEALARLGKIPFGLNSGDLKLSPSWDGLRDDPRFERLLAEVVQPFPVEQ